MFRYILAILLINTSYQSLGHPLSTEPKQILSSSISAVASSCPNAFIKGILQSKVNECSVAAPPYRATQVQCLIMYDMGSQLCKASSASEFPVIDEANYIKDINEAVEVTNLCNTLKTWKFTNLLEYPSYIGAIESIHKDPSACAKLCGTDDISNNDSNFFCKFYEWGWKIVTPAVSSNISLSSTNVASGSPSVGPTTAADNKTAEVAPSSKESLDISIKSTTTSNKSKTEPVVTPKDSGTNPLKVNQITAVDGSVVNQKVVKDTVLVKKEETNAFLSKQGVSKPPNPVEADVNLEIPKIQETVINGQNSLPLPDDVNQADPHIDEPNNKVDGKEPTPKHPKSNISMDPDHYGDGFNSEGDKDGVDDFDGDDEGGETMPGDGDKPIVKETQEADSKIEPIGSSFNKAIPSREDFSGAQDVGPEDEDHFFTFFLTAVVLVMLLYVLYHDKSRISKLFFGLLVEGRHGRRRNSRGHAYRRLDTLEQAMSSNTAAPPSKIIY